MTGTTDDRNDGTARLDEGRPVVIHSTPTDDRPVVITRPDVAAGAGAGTGVGAGVAAPGRRRALVLLALVVGLAVAAVAVAGWLLTRGGNDPVAATPAPAAEPAGPAPLSLTIQVPDPVVAGRPATVTVTYADGAGTYSGSQEDWGDGIGTSSLKEGRCAATGTAAPVSGSYQATHTWARPGTYRLTVGVTSYTCVDGAAVEEQASRAVTVTVAGG